VESAKHQKRLSRDEINQLPLRRYDGPIEVVDSADKLPAAVDCLRAEPLLGFDTETRPAFRKGRSYLPSLVQLAGAECVYLFQIRRLPATDGLWDLLAAASIVKAGVSVADDIKGLQEIAPFEARGFVDLGDVAKQAGIENHGLRGLAANLLGFRVSKKAQISNWAREELTPQQVVYAATDAWVSRRIYERMRELDALP